MKTVSILTLATLIAVFGMFSCTSHGEDGFDAHSALVSFDINKNEPLIYVRAKSTGKKDNRREVLAIRDSSDGKKTILVAYACGTLLEYTIDNEYLKTNQDEVLQYIDEIVEKVCK